ncbi:DUF3925 family protein [Priestia taiwanensis]|uniref:Uncharacterized protein n=1 Tax=Priestia taiwanensis TaxID=1347902 RepID=A0A917AK70_9BACI|nr:DUF3925 family protein [Priestia taiwanensis]MBM7361898.1 hypothetical protein [Priestia taiwanensis]GGE57825.1 hypothetical protein GCM10007140_05260 [Priestia taiwanensis]
MKRNKKHGMSNAQFYFILYVTALFFVGWIVDTTGIISTSFNLYGLIFVPTIGSAIGYTVWKIFNKKPKLYVVR